MREERTWGGRSWASHCAYVLSMNYPIWSSQPHFKAGDTILFLSLEKKKLRHCAVTWHQVTQ